MNIYQPTGFLSPTGELIECGYMEHLSTAEEICKKNNWNSINPVNELENRGFVHLMITTFFSHEYYVYWTLHLTPEQIKFLKPIFELSDNDLPIPINIGSRVNFEYEIENN